eukprot:452506-Prymnesium_polylepis.1
MPLEASLVAVEALLATLAARAQAARRHRKARGAHALLPLLDRAERKHGCLANHRAGRDRLSAGRRLRDHVAASSLVGGDADVPPGATAHDERGFQRHRDGGVGRYAQSGRAAGQARCKRRRIEGCRRRRHVRIRAPYHGTEYQPLFVWPMADVVARGGIGRLR